MAGGYPSQSPEPLAPFTDPIAALLERVRRLETPTGTSMTNLVAQVQSALADLSSQVDALVQASMGNYYTKAQTDSKVASPGAISPTTVNASSTINASGSITSQGSIGANVDMNASGRVSSQGPIVSPGSHNFNVTTGYVAAWINGDGTFGTSASTRRVKRDLTPMGPNVAQAILSLVPRWGHYIWDPEDDPAPKAFLIAEEVADLGIFAEDVLVRDEEGLPLSINYSQLVPALIATVRALNARLEAVEGRVLAL